MFSIFACQYEYGQCKLTSEEMRCYKPAILDWFGGVGLAPNAVVDNESPLQENVLSIVESGPGKLQDLKDSGDPRCTWVSDLDWTST